MRKAAGSKEEAVKDEKEEQEAKWQRARKTAGSKEEAAKDEKEEQEARKRIKDARIKDKG